MKHAGLVFAAFFLAAPAGAGERPFRRIVFEEKVPLGEHAPRIAVEGHLVAFGAGREVRVVDLRTGGVVHRFEAPVPEGADCEVRVLGLVKGTIYVAIRYFEDRPDPGGNLQRVSGGPLKGRTELVAFGLDGTQLNDFGQLSRWARFADEPLAGELLYAEGSTLCVMSLPDGETREFALPARAQGSPTVRGGAAFGLFEGGLYSYTPGEGRVETVHFHGTALESVVLRPHAEPKVELSGDLILASGPARGGRRAELVVCDFSGKLRWRVQLRHWSKFTTGPNGDIYACGGCVYRFAREDGRAPWKRYFHVDWGRAHGVAILDRRLIVFAEDAICVYDVETGRLLVDLWKSLDKVRKASHTSTVWLRMLVAENVLVAGFEDRVFGVDLTPTAEVPEQYRAKDPANAAKEIASFLQRAGPKGRSQAFWLASIGRRLADTPEAAAELVPFVRKWAWKEDGRPDRNLVTAFHWLEDDMIFEAMVQLLRPLKPPRYDKRGPVLLALACYPDQAKAMAVLKEIASDAETFPAGLREMAALQLRLSGETFAAEQAELQMLFGGDREAAVEEFRKRLGSDDARARRAAFELLKMAPDRVILALRPELARLRGVPPRGLNALILGAIKRTEAVGRFRAKHPRP